MSQQGQITYTVTVNDSNVTSKVANVNRSINSIGTTAQTAATETGSLSTNINNVGNASSTGVSKMQRFGSAVGTIAANFGVLSGGILGLVRGYRDLNEGQVAVTAKTKALSAAQQKLVDKQAALKKLTDAGIKSGPKYEKALGDVQRATQGVEVAQGRLSIAQKNYNDSTQDFYLQLIPTIIGVAGTIASTFTAISSGGGNAAKGIDAVGSSVGGAMKKMGPWMIAIIAISAILLAIRTNAFGFRDALDSVGKAIGDMLPFLKPLLQWIRDFSAALGLTGGEMDFSKAFQLLSDGFKTAVDTIMKTDWSKVLGDIVTNISDYLKNVNWNDVWVAFQNALFAGGTWVGAHLGEVWGKITDWFTHINWLDVWKRFQDALWGAGAWVGQQLSNVWAGITDWFTKINWLDVWKRFQDALWGAGTWVAQQLGNVWGDIQDWFTKIDWLKVWQRFQDALYGAGSWVKEQLGNVWGSITNWFTKIDWLKVWARFQDALYGAGSWVKEQLGNIWGGITNWFTHIDWLGLWNRFHDSMFAAGTWIVNGVKQIGNDIKTKVQSGVTELQNAGAAIWEQIAKGMSISALNFQTSKTVDWGAIWKKIQDFFSPQTAEGGLPGMSLSIDTVGARNQIDGLVNRLTALPGIIDEVNKKLVLKADGKPAIATMDAVIAVWRTKSTTIGAILAPLKADSKPATQTMDALTKVWQSKATTIGSIVAQLKANASQALAAINTVVNAQGKIKNILQIIKGDNRDALNKINQVVNAQGKIKNITQTITTVYRTVGSPVRSAHNITGIRAHNVAGFGAGTTSEASVAPLIGGGSMTNNMLVGGGGGQGDVNITIINRDEFGTEKIRKFKAVLGKDRYVFGSVGAGG